MIHDDLQSTVNIGPKLAAGLRRIGIDNLAMLRERGALSAWEDLRRESEFDCVHSLLAITGALAGVRWHDLPEQQRVALAGYVRGSGN